MQHIGFFYKVNTYTGVIQNDVELDEIINDSLGADFYEISNLVEDNLSAIALLQLKKLGYFNIDKRTNKKSILVNIIVFTFFILIHIL